MKNDIKISQWLWVIYPVVVIIILIVGINYFMTSGTMDLTALTTKPEEAQANQRIADELRSKLATLKSLDKDTELENLKKLLVAYPASRKVWYLVTEVQDAATAAGAQIDSYTGVVGDIKEASGSAKTKVATPSAAMVDPTLAKMYLTIEFMPGDFSQIYGIVKSLESKSPLVRISKLEYSPSGTTMTVEGAWATWAAPDLDATKPMLDYKTLENVAFGKISTLTGLTY